MACFVWNYASLESRLILARHFPWVFDFRDSRLATTAWEKQAVMSAFWIVSQGYQKMLDKLSFKREKILDIQKALKSADVNQDNKLDFEEWRANLKSWVQAMFCALEFVFSTVNAKKKATSSLFLFFFFEDSNWCENILKSFMHILNIA